MKKPFLEITYRQGKPFAAYLYLERQPGDKADRTQRQGGLLVDLTKDGRVIGIEFTNMSVVDLAAVNRIMAAGHQPEVTKADLVPLVAA